MNPTNSMTDSLQLELQHIREGAAIFPLTDRAFLRITGSDATRWLNGMVTNNIKDLAPGEGNYNFLLSAQGRIQGDCTIYREPHEAEPTFLLETDIWQLETVESTLDKFIIMDDVELSQTFYIQGVLTAQAGVALVGSSAPEILISLLGGEGEMSPAIAPAAGSLIRAFANGAMLVVLAKPAVSIPAYEIWCESQREADLILASLFRKTVLLSPETIEAHRILSGTPKYGTDIRNTETAKDLPQETAQAHALNFNKGCYLGQEIVERIHSRGQVHRTFTRFTLEGTLPAVPTPLEANGKSAGELTSVAQIGDTLVALGYARREALETHQPLTYSGGTAKPV
jgi:folate-binding protein YgfZ